MRSIMASCCVAIALAGSAGALGCEVSDNVLNIDDPRVNFDTDVDTDNVEQGQEVTVNVNVNDGTLVAPEEEVPAGTEAAVYVQIHLDDTSNAPLLVTAEASATVTIPPETPPGKHKLICAVHDHETKEPTGDQSEIEITVTASATVTE